MSEENVEVVRRAVNAFNHRDLSKLAPLVDPEIEFVPYLAATLERRTYRGRQGLLTFLAEAGSAWEEIRVEASDYRSGEADSVLALGRLCGHGKESGIDIDVRLAWVVRLRRGRIMRVESYADRADALEAAGLSK